MRHLFAELGEMVWEEEVFNRKINSRWLIN